MNTLEKLERLRSEMCRLRLDACLILSGDPHGSPVTAPRFRDAEWLTGFSVPGTVIAVTAEHAQLWTNSMYLQTAERVLEGSPYTVSLAPGCPLSVPTRWLTEILSPGSRVYVNDTILSAAAGRLLGNRLADKKITLTFDPDPIDRIRPGVPSFPVSPIWELPIETAGRTAAQKAAALRMTMSASGATHYVLSSLSDIAWLFNLRGGDIPSFPVGYAYAMLAPSGTWLFIDYTRLTAGAAAMLDEQGITVSEYESFFQYLDTLPEDAAVALDPTHTALRVLNRIKSRIIELPELTRRFMTIKTPSELAGTAEACLRGSAGFFRFLTSLEDRIAKGASFTLAGAAELLNTCLSRGERYICEAFPTELILIPSDGNPVSFRDDPDTVLTLPGVLTIRCGVHYSDGTFLLSRTAALGIPSRVQINAATSALRCQISGASGHFPPAASSDALNAFLRRPLWDSGTDSVYPVGHGVGHVTLSAEEPFMDADSAPSELHEGMLLFMDPRPFSTDSPSLCFGNLFVLQALCGTTVPLLAPKPLTFCPIDRSLIDLSSLTPHETESLQSYQESVLKKLEPLLNEPEQNKLRSMTQPNRLHGRHSAD